MAKMITDLEEIATQNENDLLIIYDKLQEKTSTIKASKFRGAVTHTSINTVATPPATDLVDLMFTDRHIKPNDFWRDDTTAVDGSYREYQVLTVDYTTGGVTWSAPTLYTPREPFVFPAGEQAPDYVVPTDQSDALFNGIAVVAGDQVRWQVAGSTTNKEGLTSRCIVNADDSLDWGNNQSTRPTVTHASGGLTHPTQNDADYTVGDYIEGADGNKYGPYVEGETDPLVAWPLYRQRTVHQYTLDVADSDELIDLNALNALIDTWTPYPFAGDKLLVSITGHPRQQLYTIRKNDETDDNYRPTNGFQVTDGHNPKAPITYNEHNAVWPARDDNHYSAADFIRAVGNDFMFGPYVSGRTNDVDAWPLMDRRTVRTFDLLEESGGVTFITDNAATYTALDDLSVYPGLIHGDKIILTTVGLKRVQYDIHRVDSTDEVYLPASGFVATNRSNPDEPVTHRSDALGYPAIDDETVRVGDYHRTSNGNIFGPYVEGEIVEALAWPIHTIRPVTVHRRDVADDAATRNFNPFTLPWPIDGDKIIFTLPTGKTVDYDIRQVTATDNPFTPDDGFELVNRRNGRNAIFHNATTAGQPVRNEDLYGTGDSIISTDGIIYGPYTEEQATDILAAPLIVNMAAAAATGNPIITQEGTGTKFMLGIAADGRFFREDQ